MLASQFVPGGICFPKRGVHRTGTISTGCQLSALLPNELGEPAVQLIALAALQHADVLLDDDLCGFCSRPSGSHSGCLVAATCICDITAGTQLYVEAAAGRQEVICDTIADHGTDGRRAHEAARAQEIPGCAASGRAAPRLGQSEKATLSSDEAGVVHPTSEPDRARTRNSSAAQPGPWDEPPHAHLYDPPRHAHKQNASS